MLAQPWSRRANLPGGRRELKRRPRVSEWTGLRMINVDEVATFAVLRRVRHLLHVTHGKGRDMEFLAFPRQLVTILISDPISHTNLKGINILEASEHSREEFTLCPL